MKKKIIFTSITAIVVFLFWIIEDVKREEVVDYVRKKYGPLKVAPIMTYGTLASKQVLKDVSKALNGNQFLIESFTKNIDSKITLINSEYPYDILNLTIARYVKKLNTN